MILLRSLVFSILLSGPLLAAEPPHAVFPLNPTELLATLPATPTDWTLVRSDGGTNFGEWLTSRATRVFQPPPPPPGTVPAPGPREVEITIVDTGGFAPTLTSFADFRPEKTDAMEKLYVGGLPALTFPLDEGKQFIEILVAGRLIVEITLTGLPQVKAETWLRALHFDALPRLENSLPATRQNEYRVSYLDELHPEKNRAYNVAPTDSEGLTKILKTASQAKESEPTPAAQTTR